MFFTLSKLFWFVANPINLIGLLSLLTVVLLVLRWRRTALAAAATATLIFVLSAWTSLGALLLVPLEERFQRPDPMPDNVAGIILLGGGFEGRINLARGGYETGVAGDRAIETAILARRFPDARVLISGGTGTLILEGEGDADSAPRLLEALGVDPARMILENRSRNTHENAVFSRELAVPRPGETWLLVTSAFHMPRSMGLFRKAGFEVVAWPSDYRTAGNETPGLMQASEFDSLRNMNTALREWLGLVAYRLTGRLDEFLPGPEPEPSE
ncbi:MAG: YdcF family protein [Mesorhizobium sp.]|nr:YdcF family protein [Mesorhizobium sp.]